MPTFDPPRLSVVVVIVGDTVTGQCTADNLAGTLAALVRQRDAPPIEVIVPYHRGVSGIEALYTRFPTVRFVFIAEVAGRSVEGGSREHHDTLRARGVALAQGEIIACLEDHVRPAPDWAAQVIAAHQQPYAAIGGAIENAVDHPLHWAAYFCDLGKYQNPVRAGESPCASTVNIAYKRAALTAIRPVWQTHFNETQVNAALVQRGGKLALTRAMIVYQARGPLTLATAAREFFVWGRSYATRRSQPMPRHQRWLYALLAPWLPVLLLWRLSLTIVQKGRTVRAFVVSFPFVVLFTVAWAWGELVGYWQAALAPTARPVSQPCSPPRVAAEPPAAEVADSVSVVIAWVNPLDLLTPGLDALLYRQTRVPDEVIVVTRHGKGLQRQLQHAYPAVTLLAAPPTTPIPALRSLGLRQAHGAIVAITEDHCIPGPDWIRTIHQTLGSRVGIVGGPVENACTGRLRDWAAFLTEYAGAIQPAAMHVVEPVALPGNNAAYRRELVADLRQTLDSGRWESFYHDQLAGRAVPLIFEPRLTVLHRRPFDFWYFVRQRYHFSRSFAAMRSQTLDLARRALYALGSVILPPLLLWRGLTTLQRKGRFVRLYLRCLPLIGLYVTVGAMGEMVGYVLGGGRSLEYVE